MRATAVGSGRVSVCLSEENKLAYTSYLQFLYSIIYIMTNARFKTCGFRKKMHGYIFSRRS